MISRRCFWLLGIVAVSFFAQTVAPFLLTPPPTLPTSHNRHVTQTRRAHRVLQSHKNEEEDWLSKRLQKADFTEIRLDATLCMCHSLARFLVYDISLPPKTVPALELQDIIQLVQAFSSAILLALVWTAAGLLCRVFEDSAEDEWQVVAATTSLAGPLWIELEILLGYPPSAMEDSSILMTVIAGTLGLFMTMILGRKLASIVGP